MQSIAKCFLLTLSFISLFLICDVQAKSRDKIGVVLSGGGAKGTAHIGVLKVLEANNVPIDYIVGTSIGAYVAGLYALGYSPDQIEKIMMDLHWDRSFSDSIPRDSLHYESQKLKDKYNIPLRFGYSDKTFKSPTGLLLGQTSTQLLRQSTNVIPMFESFDLLATPYRAVATDLTTASPIVLDKGSITQAMSASAAVPGVIEPVTINNHLLVDGGISNNLPIDIVKEMGADRIITVDIGSPLLVRDEINNTLDVLNQLSTILTNNTTIKQLENLAVGDLYIRPAIDHLSTVDFSIMSEALELGEAAATTKLKEIQLFSVSPHEYQAYLQSRDDKSKHWLNDITKPITALEFHNSSLVSEHLLREYFGIEEGDVVSEIDLQKAVDRVYALDKFERVDAEFIDVGDERTLVLITVPKSWGPNYINTGLNFQSDFRDTTIVSLNAAYILTDLNDSNAQLKNEITLGWELTVSSEFYQPIGLEQDFYSRTSAAFQQDKWIESEYRSELVEEYFSFYTGLGYSFDYQGIVELGLRNDVGRLRFKRNIIDDINYISYGADFTFGYDNLNSYYFPTEGNKYWVNLAWLKDEYESEQLLKTQDDSIVLNAEWRGAFSIESHTFVGMANITTVNNDQDFSVHITELGGFLNLSGYSSDSLIGLHKAFAGIVYQYDLGRDFPGSTDLPLYIGTSLEAGNVWTDRDNVNFNDLITSASFFIGTDTSYGPAVIGFGAADDGEQTFFLSFGKIW